MSLGSYKHHEGAYPFMNKYPFPSCTYKYCGLNHQSMQSIIHYILSFTFTSQQLIDTICAVARSDVQKQKIYHINFLATRMDADNGGQDKRVLFFAQIFLALYSPQTQREKNFSGKNCVQSFCCPVTISAFLGKRIALACKQKHGESVISVTI